MTYQRTAIIITEARTWSYHVYITAKKRFSRNQNELKCIELEILWGFRISASTLSLCSQLSRISCATGKGKFWNIHRTHPISSSSVFCPRAGSSLQTQEPRLQFCPKAGLTPQTQEQRSQFFYIASCCFPHPTLSLSSEQTLKDLKRSQDHQRGGEESGFG